MCNSSSCAAQLVPHWVEWCSNRSETSGVDVLLIGFRTQDDFKLQKQSLASCLIS